MQNFKESLSIPSYVPVSIASGTPASGVMKQYHQVLRVDSFSSGVCVARDRFQQRSTGRY